MSKVDYLNGKPVWRLRRTESHVFLTMGTNCRKFRKFARRHPVDAQRIEERARKLNQDMADWKASGLSYNEFFYGRS
jgi:hypothetical protein